MLLIFFRVGSGIRGLFLSARDTVALHTPAALAMSANVVGFVGLSAGRSLFIVACKWG